MKLLKKPLSFLAIICLSFSLVSCGSPSGSVAVNDFQEFNNFTNELFTEAMKENTINMHSLLRYPENYGIKDYKVTLGGYDFTHLDNTSELVETITKLKSFNRKRLSASQQITYDQLLLYFETELEYCDLYLYSSELTPTTGIQISLPIIFAEYEFYKEKDIEDYIELVSQTGRYFDELMSFEKLRAEKGLFMTDDIADQVIDQCRIFLDSMSNKDDNYLISTFNDRLDAFNGLSGTKRDSYKAANEDAVMNMVLPAYERLIEQITELKGTNKYGGGLANTPLGKKYYEYCLRSDLGWSKSIDDFNKLLDQYLTNSMLSISLLLAKDPTLLDTIDQFSFALTDPAEILADLKNRIKDEFPDPPAINYDIKYIHKSLEDYASPAMYFIPQLDNFKDNVIYINNGNTDSSSLYTTLAHEGFPGHMYQSTYFTSLNPDPIRSIIRPGGYAEGWASYCESLSYSMGASSNPAQFELMDANYQATMMLHCKVDVGIHYYGWTLADTEKFLADFGFSDPETAKSMYNSMSAEPANFPQYVLGMIAFFELRKTAESTLGDRFDPKKFHKFIMDLGPVPFDMLEQHMNVWMDQQD